MVRKKSLWYDRSSETGTEIEMFGGRILFAPNIHIMVSTGFWNAVRPAGTAAAGSIRRTLALERVGLICFNEEDSRGTEENRV
jgi:hypothetical protein